jgi:DUF1365 family protein
MPTIADRHATADRDCVLTGAVHVLTNPISAGYVQNPISVYYCYSTAGKLQQCIAEVTNTPWGERVRFLFDAEGTQVPKCLHVSPMMDMENTWYGASSLSLSYCPWCRIRMLSISEHE